MLIIFQKLLDKTDKMNKSKFAQLVTLKLFKDTFKKIYQEEQKTGELPDFIKGRLLDYYNFRKREYEEYKLKNKEEKWLDKIEI